MQPLHFGAIRVIQGAPERVHAKVRDAYNDGKVCKPFRLLQLEAPVGQRAYAILDGGDAHALNERRKAGCVPEHYGLETLYKGIFGYLRKWIPGQMDRDIRKIQRIALECRERERTYVQQLLERRQDSSGNPLIYITA